MDVENVENIESIAHTPKENSTFGKIAAKFRPRTMLIVLATVLALMFVMFLAVYTRSSTLGVRTVLDYDPWWWYRHTEDIINNNMMLPAWDELSFFPPGRATEPFQGWPYAMAIFYQILHPLLEMTLTEVAKWSTLIVAAATVIPAFLLGRLFSNKIGGLATAVFSVLSPSLIGVSMAGYCDTDMIVHFYTFLSVYSISLAIKKEFGVRAIPYYIFAILANLAFVFTWGYGWIIMIFFAALVPGIVIFRVIEQIIHSRSLRLNVAEIKKETIAILIPLVIIMLPVNIIGQVFGLSNMVSTLIDGVIFFQGKALLVNISVAELQQINILTSSGFNEIVDRVGLGTVIFTFLLPLVAFYKMFKKEKISPSEIFLFLWIFITFILISKGVRFSLLFSGATAATAGYVIGSMPKYLKNTVVKATFYGFVLLVTLMFVSTAITVGYQSAGMEISGNWYNMLDWLKANANTKSLVVTWWDPGHIIAGYTGLRVHADGAHCGIGACIPYNHNTRIQDMGRMFTTDNESETVQILDKYIHLAPDECQKAKDKFGDAVPADACDPIPEVYFIASSDLIGKYYWMSYFGDCLKQMGLKDADACYSVSPDWFRENAQGRNFLQLGFTNYDSNQGIISYSGGQLSLVFNNGQWVPVLNMPDQGIRNVVVREVVYFENGQQKHVTYNDTQAIEGMIWVDPSYSTALFMDASVRDSIFTRMFLFNGEGLEHFKLVYQNGETKLFKVVW